MCTVTQWIMSEGKRGRLDVSKAVSQAVRQSVSQPASQLVNQSTTFEALQAVKKKIKN